MKPSSYWQKRFEQLKRDELLATNGSLAETRKLYDRIERSIEKDLAYWYGRYLKNNGGISYQDAQKALSKKELAEFRWTVEEYIEKAKTLELSPEWHKALENASIKAHVTRLESLKLQLSHHSEVLHDTLNKNLGKDLRKVYEGQYYKNLFEIQKGLGQGRLIEALDPSFLDLVIHKPWHKDGLDFSSRVWQARDRLIRTLEQELTYIAIRGDSPDGAIRRISQLFGKSRSHSAMLVQTEHAALASRAQQDAFKALDVEEFEYIATLDGKTSELCQSMDGKHFPMSEYQVGLTAPPLHPRCRSCTAPYFEDMEAPRWARDKDGKGYVITKDLRYNEWEEKYVGGVFGRNDSLKESKAFKSVKEACEANGVEYKKVKKLRKPLSEQEIIEKLAGGDMTKGSCASLTLAYIGNKHGIDVIDFRGGNSQAVFSSRKNLEKISELPGVNTSVTMVKKESSEASEIIKTLEPDKEYCLIVGRHAAIVRRSKDRIEYLELQSEKYSGWTSFNAYGSIQKTLELRFGCRKTVKRSLGIIFKRPVMLIEVDSFKGSTEFEEVLGYINTAVEDQQKGASGDVK